MRLKNLAERESFARIIKTWRGNEKVRPFARKLGISHTTLIAWEKVESDPNFESLARVARMRGQTVEQLMQEVRGEQPSAPLDSTEDFLRTVTEVARVMNRQQLAQLLQAIAKGLEASDE